MRIMAIALAALLVAACAANTQQPDQTASASGATGAEAPPATQPPPPAEQPASQPPPSAPAPTRQQPAPRPPAPAPSQPRPTNTASAPVTAPKPMMIEVPAGTVLALELTSDLSSKTSQKDDPFTAKVVEAVAVGNQVVIPEGSTLDGVVTQAVSAKQMTGQAVLSLQFTQLNLPSGDTVPISASITEKGKKIGKRTGAIVGGSAAGGAVLGRIIGKDTKGAVVGAVLGAAAGTGIAAAQKGQELKLPTGSGVDLELDQAIEVPVHPQGS